MTYGGEFNQTQLEELCQAIARRIAGEESPGVLACESMDDARTVVKRTVQILAEWGIGRPGGEYERVYGPNERKWPEGSFYGVGMEELLKNGIYFGVDMGMGESWAVNLES